MKGSKSNQNLDTPDVCLQVHRFRANEIIADDLITFETA